MWFFLAALLASILPLASSTSQSFVHFTHAKSRPRTAAGITLRAQSRNPTPMSQRVLQALRIETNWTLTAQCALQHSPVSWYLMYSRRNLVSTSTQIEEHPDRECLLALTYLSTSYQHSEPEEIDIGSYIDIVRELWILFVGQPYRHGIDISNTQALSTSNGLVHHGAYEIPNDSVALMFQLKRSGFLWRAYFAASMYRSTTLTAAQAGASHPSSWFDVLDADALARHDALETLSVEYELWTHVYDLEDAPLHLQYTTFKACRKIHKDAMRKWSTVEPGNTLASFGRWLLCPSPTPVYGSIVFAGLQRTHEHIMQYELRLPDARKHQSADTNDLRQIIIVTGAVLFYTVHSNNFDLTLNIRIVNNSTLHKLQDSIRIAVWWYANSSHLSGARCTRHIPMICHFSYIHEFAYPLVSVTSNSASSLGYVAVWAHTHQAEQYIRNVSVVHVPLSRDEYATVLHRRDIINQYTSFYRGHLEVFYSTLRDVQSTLDALCVLERHKTQSSGDPHKVRFALRIRSVMTKQLRMQRSLDIPIPSIEPPQYVLPAQHVDTDHIDSLVAAAAHGKEALQDAQRAVSHLAISPVHVSYSDVLQSAPSTSAKLDALAAGPLRDVVELLERHRTTLDSVATAVSTRQTNRKHVHWPSVLIGCIAGVVTSVLLLLGRSKCSRIAKALLRVGMPVCMRMLPIESHCSRNNQHFWSTRVSSHVRGSELSNLDPLRISNGSDIELDVVDERTRCTTDVESIVENI